MGGKAEQKIECIRLDGTKHSIRVHESDGEVHFHDDSQGLKVAIKVFAWFNAWQKLRTMQSNPFRWDYLDVENKAQLTVVLSRDTEDNLHVDLFLKKADEFSENFLKLDKFMNTVV